MSDTATVVRQDDIHRIETLARLSRVVVHNGIAYVSGTLADDPNGTVEEQTQNILSKIDRWLESAGSDKTHVLTATVWLKNVADAPRLNRIWEAWVPQGYASSRSVVQAIPGRAEFAVEIALQAAVA